MQSDSQVLLSLAISDDEGLQSLNVLLMCWSSKVVLEYSQLLFFFKVFDGDYQRTNQSKAK